MHIATATHAAPALSGIILIKMGRYSSVGLSSLLLVAQVRILVGARLTKSLIRELISHNNYERDLTMDPWKNLALLSQTSSYILD